MKQARYKRWQLLAGVAAALLPACGGKTFVESSGDAAPPPPDSGMTGDAGTHACPPSMPSGGACSPEGRVCAYGTDPRPDCRPTTTCTNGNWINSLHTCPVPPAAQCPPTRQAAQGQSCSPEGGYCTYEQGLSCNCTRCPPSAPICQSGGAKWSCEAPNSDPMCPTAIPNLGTTCSPDGQSCYYGCEPGRGRMCQGGVWVISSSLGGCPVSSRLAKRGISYLSASEREALADEILHTRLATYEYMDPARAGQRHLGFLLEDNAPTFASDAEHNQVDLYGYTSTLVAAVQLQQARIDTLEREMQSLRTHCSRP